MASQASAVAVPAVKAVPGLRERQVLYLLLGFSAGLPFYMFSTVLSLRLQAHQVGLVIIGLVARGYGIPSAWLCSAAFFAVTAPGFLLLGRIAARTPLPEVVVPPALRPSP